MTNNIWDLDGFGVRLAYHLVMPLMWQQQCHDQMAPGSIKINIQGYSLFILLLCFLWVKRGPDMILSHPAFT